MGTKGAGLGFLGSSAGSGSYRCIFKKSAVIIIKGKEGIGIELLQHRERDIS